jgi:hypothetical protein
LRHGAGVPVHHPDKKATAFDIQAAARGFPGEVETSSAPYPTEKIATKTKIDKASRASLYSSGEHLHFLCQSQCTHTCVCVCVCVCVRACFSAKSITKSLSMKQLPNHPKFETLIEDVKRQRFATEEIAILTAGVVLVVAHFVSIGFMIFALSLSWDEAEEMYTSVVRIFEVSTDSFGFLSGGHLMFWEQKYANQLSLACRYFLLCRSREKGAFVLRSQLIYRFCQVHLQKN